MIVNILKEFLFFLVYSIKQIAIWDSDSFLVCRENIFFPFFTLLFIFFNLKYYKGHKLFYSISSFFNSQNIMLSNQQPKFVRAENQTWAKFPWRRKLSMKCTNCLHCKRYQEEKFKFFQGETRWKKMKIISFTCKTEHSQIQFYIDFSLSIVDHLVFMFLKGVKIRNRNTGKMIIAEMYKNMYANRL